MQYEIKGELEYIGAPKTKNLTAYTQCINITSGVVGQTYDGFTNKDIAFIDFPATGLDADGIKTLVQSGATQFVSIKYPNT